MGHLSTAECYRKIIAKILDCLWSLEPWNKRRECGCRCFQDDTSLHLQRIQETWANWRVCSRYSLHWYFVNWYKFPSPFLIFLNFSLNFKIILISVNFGIFSKVKKMRARFELRILSFSNLWNLFTIIFSVRYLIALRILKQERKNSKNKDTIKLIKQQQLQS